MRLVTPSLVFAAGLLALTGANAQSLAPAAPESVGLSSERLGRISQTLRDDVAKGTLPGAVLLIARDGKVAYHEAFGSTDPQTKVPMAKGSIFRIYSMTKPFTSVAAMTWRVAELDAVVGQHGVDLVGHGLDQGAEEV